MKRNVIKILMAMCLIIGLDGCGGGGGSSPSPTATSYSISGVVTNNTSNQSSAVIIGACNDASMTNCNYGGPIGVGHLISYTIPNVTAGTYYLGVCVDVDGSNKCNVPPDFGAMYASNPVTVSNSNVAGINITIQSSSNSLAPKPGTWDASAGFGSFTFAVNSASTGIIGITYNFLNWTCGGVTMSGGITLTYAQAEPINNNTITLSDSLGTNRTMTITGQFTNATTASGTFTNIVNGTSCTGSWTAVAQ